MAETDSNDVVPLGRNDSIGLAFAAEAGIVSLVADSLVIIFLLRYFWKRHVEYKRWSSNKNTSKKPIFTAASINLFVLSLFVSDLVQATGQSLDAIWVVRWQVEPGQLCTAQGILQQTGELSAAFATLTLAVHTFYVNIGWPKPWNSWRWKRRYPVSTRTACIVIALSWIVTLCLSLTFPFLEGNYIGPTPYWCWIRRPFVVQRWLGEYLWFMITLAISFVLYTTIFVFTNRLTLKRTHFYYVAYPIIYCIITVPSTISRWYPANDNTSPAALTFASAFLFALAGLLNAGLFFYTRKQGLQVTQDEEPDLPEEAELDNDADSMIEMPTRRGSIGSTIRREAGLPK